MIDFLSMEIDSGYAEILLANPRIDFEHPINLSTGELFMDKYGAYCYNASLGNLKIKIRKYTSMNKTKVNVSGSIHKFHMGNNYQDFYFTDIVNAIIQITQFTEIPANEFKIHQIEFGVNFCTELRSSQILENIISHKGNEYELKTFRGMGYLKKFEWSNYTVKTYDKGRQYGLNQNLIRFEIKANKMQYLEQKNITIQSLADLLNSEIYYKLSNLILKTFKELIFTDDVICINNIKNVVDKSVFIEYNNPRRWKALRIEKNTKKLNRKLSDFREIIKEHSNSNIQETHLKIIQSKCELLIQNVPLLPVSQNNEMSHYYTDVLLNNKKATLRQCITCGRDISIQKSTSKYCSEKLFGREVKRCRNRISNLRRDELNRYPSQTLFDVDQYLSDEYRRWKSVALKTSI